MLIRVRTPYSSLFFGQRAANSISCLLDCARVIFVEIVVGGTAITFVFLLPPYAVRACIFFQVRFGGPSACKIMSAVTDRNVIRPREAAVINATFVFDDFF